MESKPTAQPDVSPIVLMGGAVILAAAGFLIHNIREFGLTGLVDPGTFTLFGVAIFITLFAAWTMMSARRRWVAMLLLGWGVLHLVGGAIISVLPLGFLPFVPEQTIEHYVSHAVYGVLQLPLIGLCIQSLRSK